MFALDTNVLVRYIVRDDVHQTRKASAWIETLTTDKPAFISIVVLCELCWVLKSAYGASREECATAIEAVLEVPVFQIENIDLCNQALQAFKRGVADFSDFVIREVAMTAHCEGVKTFDKKALREEGFVVL